MVVSNMERDFSYICRLLKVGDINHLVNSFLNESEMLLLRLRAVSIQTNDNRSLGNTQSITGGRSSCADTMDIVTAVSVVAKVAIKNSTPTGAIFTHTQQSHSGIAGVNNLISRKVVANIFLQSHRYLVA